MLNLLIKDFKLMLGSQQSASQRVLSAIFSVLFFVAFAVVEMFLFQTILNTIGNIKNAPMAFLTVFLCVTTIIITVSTLFNAKRLFFDNKDIEQLSNHPITNGQIIVSKLLYLFFIHYVTSILFEYPLLFAFGRMLNKTVIFYFTALFYPVMSFFFETGVALLLVYPVWMLTRLLKKHFLFEMGFSLLIIFGLSFAYSYVLDIFIQLVSQNGLITLFSNESLAKLISFREYAFPVNFLTDIFINKTRLVVFPFMLISLGVFGMGLAVTIYAYNYVRNMSVNTVAIKNKKAYKPVSVVKALIKKEFSLIAKNSDYIFSYTGLLIVQPLLLMFVVKSMNTALTAGTIQYFTALVPGLKDYVDILFVMLFTVIISQGANSYITMEERTIKNMKTIPVKFGIQLTIKVAIPFILSCVSLVLSVVVLGLTGVVSWGIALFSLLVSVVLLFIFDIISLWEELSIRHGKPRSTFVSSVLSYFLPLAYAVSAILLSYLKISVTLTLWCGLATIIILGALPVFLILKNADKMFLNLEAIN